VCSIHTVPATINGTANAVPFSYEIKIMVTWIVDKHILKDSRYENMPDIIQSCGYQCKVSQYIPFASSASEIIGDVQEPIIPYGTVAFCRLLKNTEGLFFNENNLRYHYYRSNLDLNKALWINEDYIIMPYNQIKQDPSRIFKLFNQDYVFIRPDSGAKLFTGFCVSPETINAEINYLDQMSGLTNHSLVILAPARKIYAEYRFIIIANEVVTGSLYIENNMHGLEIQRPLNLSLSSDNSAQKLAEVVAATSWQPDHCYIHVILE
jgi:hypothetical protein